MNNVILPDEAGLLLHRWVTEQLPIIALFTSGDSVHVTARGFVNHFTQEDGLVICTPFVEGKPLATLNFTHDIIAASTFRYADDSQVPEHLEAGSGLKIEMPSGEVLAIMEVRVGR
jgi:hypothetical protein